MSNELNVKDLDAVTGGFVGLGSFFASVARSRSSGSNPVPPVNPQPGSGWGWPEGKGPKGSRIEGCW